MPARILRFSLSVTPKQGAAARVVVCKSRCGFVNPVFGFYKTDALEQFVRFFP